MEAALAREFGGALGRESAAHGQDVLLGPGVNIVRVPHGGRNFEYYSEDPQLTADLAVGTIEGIQSEDVAATVKHYVANNHETDRYEVSADVEERALRELYLPAFRAAVEEADAHAVMTAYNRVNGTHMGEHERLISDVLKDEWGFDGVVVSDWWGTRSTIEAATAGLDIEMPGIEPEAFMPDDPEEMEVNDDGDSSLPPVPDVPAYFGEPLREAVESGAVDEAVIDEKVARVLRVMDEIGRFNDDAREGALETTAHRKLAREIAIEGTVLLENDDALPLSSDDSLAVIGPNADAAKLGGGGSSEVTPATDTSPLEGLADRADVSFERGVDPITESSFFGDDEQTLEEDTNIDAAVSAARDADCAVVIAQDDATEFTDRPDIELPGEQNDLIEPSLTSPSAPSSSSGPAVPSRCRGSSRSTPSSRRGIPARLTARHSRPCCSATLIRAVDSRSRSASPPNSIRPPTRQRSPALMALQLRRRRLCRLSVLRRTGLEPLFPFGHGLSYATIDYEDATVTETDDGIDVTVDLTNSSDRAGTEVVQVYANKAAAPVPTPDCELVGFDSVSLEAGEAATVTIALEREDFAYYDEDDRWTVADGTNRVFVGRSSRDILEAVDVSV